MMAASYITAPPVHTQNVLVIGFDVWWPREEWKYWNMKFRTKEWAPLVANALLATSTNHHKQNVKDRKEKLQNIENETTPREK